MDFNPYGSFLDFSQQNWSLGDEELKSEGPIKDATTSACTLTQEQRHPSSPKLTNSLESQRTEELSSDVKRTKSIRSEPETSVTAAMTENQESFSFEINLPPGLDVSPLSCKESVIASMMSRSIDRALEVPPLVIRASSPSGKRSRARSKSRSRGMSQNPSARNKNNNKNNKSKVSSEVVEGKIENQSRSHSKERTRTTSVDRQSRRRSRSSSREPKLVPISDSHNRSHSKERQRSSSRERNSGKTSRSRSTNPFSRSAPNGQGRSSSKERQRGTSKERRTGQGSRSKSMDPMLRSLSESHSRSHSKERPRKSLEDDTTERGTCTDQTNHHSKEEDERRRRRTRSSSAVRTKEDNRSKRSQSKVRVHVMEEIRENVGHSSPRRSHRSPSRSRRHSESATEHRSSSNRARSKSRPRDKETSSPRSGTRFRVETLDEHNPTLVQYLTLTPPVKDEDPPPPPRENLSYSPKRTPKESEAGRSNHDRTLSSRDSSHNKNSKRDEQRPDHSNHGLSPKPDQRDIIDTSHDGPESSPNKRSTRRRSSRKSADTTGSTRNETKATKKNKWSELRDLNMARRPHHMTQAEHEKQKRLEDIAVVAEVPNDMLENVLVEPDTKFHTSRSQQIDFAGQVSPGRALSEKYDVDGLVAVQPKLQNVMIRLKESAAMVDHGTSGTHNKPPASPSLASPRQRKTLQKLIVKTNSPRAGSVISGKGSTGSNDAESENSSSRSRTSGFRSKVSKSSTSKNKNASFSYEGSEHEYGHSPGKDAKGETRKMGNIRNVQDGGPEQQLSDFSTGLCDVEIDPCDDAVLVVPKMTPVVLHAASAPIMSPNSTSIRRKSSPNLPRKSISKSSELSESSSGDRLKRAGDLIREQKRKKEESKSRQKEMDVQSASSDQSPIVLRHKDLDVVIPKPDTNTASPRQSGWGLLKAKKTTISVELETSQQSATKGASHDQSIEQTDTVDMDVPSKWAGLKGASQFVNKTKVRVANRKDNRRRSYPEDKAEGPRKPSSSKWKDLSARLESQDIVKPSKGMESPEGKGNYTRKNRERNVAEQSPDTSSPGRLSKWTGLRGARAFIANAGRQSDHHRPLLDDDDEMP